MINVETKGDFKKLTGFLERAKEIAKFSNLDKYGKMGVEALSKATPVDTGLTANSWYYEIKRQNGSVELVFKNSNINEGVPIAVVLQYGHGTKSGKWIEGRDYINPAILPIFDKIVDDAWKEVNE